MSIYIMHSARRNPKSSLSRDAFTSASTTIFIFIPLQALGLLIARLLASKGCLEQPKVKLYSLLC